MITGIFKLRRSAFIIFALVLQLALLSGLAFAGKNSQLSIKEARSALQAIDANINVISTSRTAIGGFWEVVIKTSDGKNQIVYLNKDKNILFAGSLFDLDTRQNLTAQRLEDLNRVNVASIALDDALVLGNRKAPNRVIVFDDPD